MKKLYYIAMIHQKLLRPDSPDEKHPDVFSKIFFRGWVGETQREGDLKRGRLGGREEIRGEGRLREGRNSERERRDS